MPTNRKRKSRNRIVRTPDWAEALVKEHRPPQEGTDDWDDYLGWQFFGDEYPGLPDPMSPEGRNILKAARGASHAD